MSTRREFCAAIASATTAAIIPLPLDRMTKPEIKPYRADKPLLQLQQEFIDLHFGMFLHFNMATFQNREWGDPRAPTRCNLPAKGVNPGTAEQAWTGPEGDESSSGREPTDVVERIPTTTIPIAPTGRNLPAKGVSPGSVEQTFLGPEGDASTAGLERIDVVESIPATTIPIAPTGRNLPAKGVSPGTVEQPFFGPEGNVWTAGREPVDVVERIPATTIPTAPTGRNLPAKGVNPGRRGRELSIPRDDRDG